MGGPVAGVERTSLHYHERGGFAMSNEELAARIRQGETGLTETLWLQVERFVWWMANRWNAGEAAKGGVDVNDLYQCGYLAFAEALEHFDSERGSFITCLSFYLKTAFTEACGLRTARQRSDPLRSMLSFVETVSGCEDLCIGDLLVDPAAEEAFAAVDDRDRAAKLSKALADALQALPEAEREVLRARFFRAQTLEAVAAELGVNKERVRQIEAKGLRMLRHPKNNRELRRNW